MKAKSINTAVRLDRFVMSKSAGGKLRIGALLLAALTLTAYAGVGPQLNTVISGAKPVFTLHDANQPAISADGRRLVVSPQIGVTEMYDVSSGRKMCKLYKEGSLGHWISADGKRFVIFALPSLKNKLADNVWFYDAESCKEIGSSSTYFEYKGHFAGRLIVYGGDAQTINNISSDLRWIAGSASTALRSVRSLENRPAVWLWDIEQHRLERSFGQTEVYDQFNADNWYQVKLTPDARVLAATRTNPNHSEKRETVVWSTNDGQTLLRLPFASYWLALSDDGRRLVTVRSQTTGDSLIFGTTLQGEVRVIPKPGQAQPPQPERPPAEVWDVTMGRRIAVIGENGGERPPMVRGMLSPNGNLLVTASFNYLLVWDADTGRLLAAQPHDQADRDRLKTVSFSGDGQYLIMSSMNEVVKVFLVADVLRDARNKGTAKRGW